MSKKNKLLTIIIVTAIIITGIAIAIPISIIFVKDNTLKLVDYAADSFKDEKDYSQEVERQSDENKQNKINDDFSDNILKLQIGQNDILINTSYDTEVYELENLYTDVPLDINIKDSTDNIVDDINMTIDGQEIDDNNLLELEALDKDKYIEVKLQYDTYNRTYYVQTLPTNFPEFEKHGISKYEGDYYSNFYIEGDPYSFLAD